MDGDAMVARSGVEYGEKASAQPLDLAMERLQVQVNDMDNLLDAFRARLGRYTREHEPHLAASTDAVPPVPNQSEHVRAVLFAAERLENIINGGRDILSRLDL